MLAQKMVHLSMSKGKKKKKSNLKITWVGWRALDQKNSNKKNSGKLGCAMKKKFKESESGWQKTKREASLARTSQMAGISQDVQ